MEKIDINRLRENSALINRLQKEQKESIKLILSLSRKNICQWASELPLADFKKAFLNLFVESHNKHHGTDYFTWGKTEGIQKEFESYTKMMMEGDCENENKFHEDVEKYHKNLEDDDKFFYYPTYNRFFNLKKFKYTSWSRSSHQTDSYCIDEKGMVKFTYSGTAYHGFGSVESSVQQELTIDPNTFQVKDYIDSTDKYDPRSSGIHTLNTDFLDGWVEFGKQIVAYEKNEFGG